MRGESDYMNRIITIGREFGSGGRELGRRLAEALHVEYYDKEILAQIAQNTPFTEKYIREIEMHLPHTLYPITIGKSFQRIEDYSFKQAQVIYQEQRRIIREMAGKSDCVIVGRCANHVLQDYSPYRIFVYADMESKIKRCRERGSYQADLSNEQIKQNIRKIDRNRAKYHSFHTEKEWGTKENYDLCVNTSRTTIKELAIALAQLF